MQQWMIRVAAVCALPGAAPVCDQAAASEPAVEQALPTGEESLARTLATWAQGTARASPGADQTCVRSGPVLSLPAIGHETSRFGPRLDPLGGGWRLHAGIDLAAPRGSAVVSAGSGEVLRAGWTRGYGNLVVIDHGQGLTTRYAHLDHSLVHAGQAVRPGEEIGLVGATGHATGNHLHFEVRQSGRAVDPATADMPCPDVPAMAPVLGEVAAHSGWTDPARDGALPTVVMR